MSSRFEVRAGCALPAKAAMDAPVMKIRRVGVVIGSFHSTLRAVIDWRSRTGPEWNEMRTLSAILVLSLLVVSSASLFAQQKISDDLIYDEVRRRLANDMTAQGGGIEVEVKEGVVTLSGKVKNQRQKDRAERVTKKVRGVTKVINKLAIEV
jgi:hypothetical protein